RQDLSKDDAEVVNRFWRRLSAQDRRSLAVLYDERAESCSYSSERRRDGSSAWYGVSIEVVGRFTEAPERDEPEIDFYEYLVNHELSLGDVRRFHVCTRHEAAAAAVRRGLVPASFSCPRGLAECPMRRLLDLAPGRSLAFDVQAHPSSSSSVAPVK